MTQEQIVKIVDKLTREDYRRLLLEWNKRNKAGSYAATSRCMKQVRLFKEAWQDIYHERYRFHVGEFDRQCIRDWFVQRLLGMEFSISVVARFMGGTKQEIEMVFDRIAEQKRVMVDYQLPMVYMRRIEKYINQQTKDEN